MPRTLAQNAQYIAETIKPAIKSAIEAQGVTVPSTDSFLDYADRIGEIEGGGSGYQLKDLPTCSISTVNDAAELPLNALKVSVEAWQEGTGDPSPSNVRPIHGWDTANLSITGGNVFDFDDFSGPGYPFGNGESGYIINLKAGKYIFSEKFSHPTGNGATVIKIYKTVNAVRTRIYYETYNDATDISYIIDSDVDASYTFIQYSNSSANLIKDISLIPLISYTVNFGRDVYGGSANLLTGEGVIDRISHTINDFSAWNYQGVNNYKALYIKLSDLDLPLADISKVNLCAFDKSKHIANGYGQPYGTASLYAANNGTIYFWNNDDYYSGGNAMINGMNALGGVQIVYYLAEPIPFTFTPIPTTKMLQGTNNLFADCGEVIEGEYFVDEGAHRYQLYDYIESDGTQCIDSGVKLNANDVVKCIYVPLSGMTNWNWLWIAEDTNTSKFSGVVFMSSSQMADYDYSVESNRRSWTANQISESSLTASAAINANVKFSDGAIVKLYSLSINDDFYLPAKRKSDGVFGLYDVTNQAFLTDSAGGNAFVGGNPIGVGV